MWCNRRELRSFSESRILPEQKIKTQFRLRNCANSRLNRNKKPFKLRSEERFSRNAETDIVCRLLLEKKNHSTSRHEPPTSPSAPPPDSGTQPTRPRCRRSTGRPRPRSARRRTPRCPFLFFFFNDTATTEIYTLSLHDALPI